MLFNQIPQQYRVLKLFLFYDPNFLPFFCTAATDIVFLFF